MLAQDIHLELEPFLANAISSLAAELRLVDISDYIAYLRMEQYGCVADIVRDAADLYFTPGFVEFGMDGEASAEWGAAPEVTLMLVINSARATTHVALKLCEHHAEIRLGFVNFSAELETRHDRVDLLVQDIDENRMRRRGHAPRRWIADAMLNRSRA